MRNVAVCLVAVLLAGCAGYRARFEIPEHLKTFTVSTFTNKTLERNVDMEFTQALIREIESKTDLRMARPGEADLVVTGEISRFDRATLTRKSQGLKNQVRYLLFVNVAMLDRRKDRMFFQGKDIVRTAEFNSNQGGTPVQAREQVIRDLARRVVGLAFERWPTPDEKADVKKAVEVRPSGG